jgi:hypothetical protein
MANQTPKQVQMTKLECQIKFRIHKTVDPPHSDSLPPGEREPGGEIATSFSGRTRNDTGMEKERARTREITGPSEKRRCSEQGIIGKVRSTQR